MKIWLASILFGISSMVIAAEPAADNVAPAPSDTPSATAAADANTDKAAQEAAPVTETAPATEAATAPATETAPAETAAEQSGFSRGSVVRSVFTTSVQEREPVDRLNNTPTEQERVFYFTELRDMSGQTATHRWEKDGALQAEVKFDVRGPRWRVWSSKQFIPESAGEWKVSVLNGAGEVIAEDTLNLTGVPSAKSEATTAEPAAENTPATENTPAETTEEKFEPPVTEMMQK